MYESIAVALNRTLADEMRRDSRVFVLGEDIATLGGAYQITKGLLQEFGPVRIRDTPCSEIAIIGASIGAAVAGMRPVAELQFADFVFCAMDQMVNQAAKLRMMFGGQASVPMVVRAPQGATGRAAQHSQCVEAYFMHTPGLKVVLPSDPYDARGLLATSIRDDNPVLFLEHKLLYGSTSAGGKSRSATGSLTTLRPAPEEDYTIPFGRAEVRRQGTDLTVVATQHMLHLALRVADHFAEESISLEVIDPRTVAPLDMETIVRSVCKTGRLVVASEDVLTCGFASEVVARVVENCYESLKAAPVRVSTLDTPIPFAPESEKFVLPNEDKIAAAVRRTLGLPPVI
jgi:acetoin:2,6-dichlorophenolindophenol oxidoreductase subunit beta